MRLRAFVFALAAVACAGVPSAGAPIVGVPAPPMAASRAAAPRASNRDDAWARLQAYLPALRGTDPELQFRLAGAYAPALDADDFWRRLATDLEAGGGGLDRTCARDGGRYLALVIDDPSVTASIGRPGRDVRVFWMPLAHVVDMTVADVIRDAGLVDGPGAQRVARGLRRDRDRAAWIDALERSPVWFLPAGDDPSIHPRRIRGYAVADVAALRSRAVHVGTNTLGGFCEIATVAFAIGDDAIGGAVHGGAEAICQLAGLRDAPECRR